MLSRPTRVTQLNVFGRQGLDNCWHIRRQTATGTLSPAVLIACSAIIGQIYQCFADQLSHLLHSIGGLLFLKRYRIPAPE